MNRVAVSSIQPEKVNKPLVSPRTLPCWENLSPERRQELVTILAVIVVKRLPHHHQRQREAAHE
jgi:hypothetical protein